jgi:protein-tyrosine phosphatase
VRERRPWREATLWMLATGAFFFVSYNLADWVTAQRAIVPSIVFAWERHIPFLAWTIVPYWSTDVLYALSFFLCRSRNEVATHGKRLLAAQLICVLVFLIFPLRFSFTIPPVDGPFGMWFAALASFDRPFNQAPSLHLALTTILWTKYSKHTRGLTRLLMRAWLVLTGVSTLTTYQHHFIDLPTGSWVGLFCATLIPGRAEDYLVRRRSLRLGAVYLSAAFACIVAAVWTGGFGWLLLWPAGSLLILSLAYFSGRPHLLGGAAPSFAVTLLLAPYLVAAKVNACAWTHGEPPAQEIAEGVWVGRSPRWNELPQIASIVTLAPEMSLARRHVALRRVSMLDLVPPSPAELEAAVQAIEELKRERPTLICCALGYSRSVSAAVAWLVATHSAPSIEAAIAIVQQRRRVVLSRAHREQLEAWAHGRGSHAA